MLKECIKGGTCRRQSLQVQFSELGVPASNLGLFEAMVCLRSKEGSLLRKAQTSDLANYKSNTFITALSKPTLVKKFKNLPNWDSRDIVEHLRKSNKCSAWVFAAINSLVKNEIPIFTNLRKLVKSGIKKKKKEAKRLKKANKKKSAKKSKNAKSDVVPKKHNLRSLSRKRKENPTKKKSPPAKRRKVMNAQKGKVKEDHKKQNTNSNSSSNNSNSNQNDEDNQSDSSDSDSDSDGSESDSSDSDGNGDNESDAGENENGDNENGDDESNDDEDSDSSSSGDGSSEDDDMEGV